MSESFAELFEQSIAQQTMQPGSIVTARVLQVKSDVVIVDAGLKSEGVIPIEEFYNDSGELTIGEGDDGSDASHTRSALSPPPVAMRVPSAENATE